MVTDSGNEFKIDANWLHNQQLDNWQGWECDAGKTRIFIDPLLDVYSGECKNEKLGSLLKDWELNVHSAVCRRARCTGCTDDLMINKKKANS